MNTKEQKIKFILNMTMWNNALKTRQLNTSQGRYGRMVETSG